jgi:hypothetical protein
LSPGFQNSNTWTKASNLSFCFPVLRLGQTASREGGKMTKALYALLGILTGAIVGSAAGLLFAPASGRELRADFQNYTTQVRNEVQQAGADRRKELEEQLARFRGEILSD